jgi:hypothetical protein
MNNYEQEANVILKMSKVVHPDYVVNSIAQFLKERDTKQKLQQHSVMQAEGSDVSEGAAVASSAAGQSGRGAFECEHYKSLSRHPFYCNQCSKMIT